MADDAAVAAHVEARAAPQDVEIWDGERKVATIRGSRPRGGDEA